MRKIILFIASSLDGYIARENGDVDWLPESGPSGYNDFYKSIDTVIMGKTTYDQVLTFGAYPYKDKKSYIFSRNNNFSKDENTKFVHDVEKLVKDVISNHGTNIWLVGGAEIISAFMNLNLVDKIILSVIPVVLGTGIPLFKNITKETKLELMKTTDYEKLVELHYKVLK
ncbi:MAG TPA: dihydrofolate reductase family protein [Nitrosopumilaceae archaeon]|jgi:dihydrofolate reductase|nr:dihydrofolate reductase family protein [Nitrosopumilaceae archaeon]